MKSFQKKISSDLVQSMYLILQKIYPHFNVEAISIFPTHIF